jgi:hypothetical protein
MRPWLRSGSSGLSLMDMLVALALLGLIGAGLGATMTLMLRAGDRADHAEATAPALTARALLRRWLAQATPPGRLTSVDPHLEGTVDRLDFVTLAPTPFAPDAAALRVSVLMEDEVLMLRATPLDDDGRAGDPIVRPLATLADGLVIDYYDARAVPPGWADAWSGEAPYLPDLVRIRLEDGSEPAWPAFVVRPLLSR